MKEKMSRATVVRGLISIAVIVALYLLIRRLSGVLLPFLVSFVIAYMLSPIVDFFQHTCRLRNRVVSVIVTLVLVTSVIVGTIAILTPMISEQVSTLSRSVQEYVKNFDASAYISPEMGENIKTLIQNLDVQTLTTNPDVQALIKKIIPKVGGLISSGINSIAGLAVIFICILYVIFLLIDYGKIRHSWPDYIPERYRERVKMLVSDLDKHMNGYFRGQALVAFIVGILFAIGFQLIGLPMGIVMGLIVGLLNLVPYMQALGIPPCILLGLIQAAETGRPIWVVALCIAAVFLVVQAIEDLFLVPKIMGDITGMGPAMILLCLSIWGSLLGVVGMIIALPITTLIISYYKRFVLQIPDNTTTDSCPTNNHSRQEQIVLNETTSIAPSQSTEETTETQTTNPIEDK